MPRFRCSKPEPVPEPTTVPCNVGAACAFDVVVKSCILATNLLKLLRQSSANRMAFGVAVFGVDCVAGEGIMYIWLVEGATGSGYLVAWALAVGFSFMGIGWTVSFCGSFSTSNPLPSSVNTSMISSWFSLGKTTSHISEDSSNPSGNSIKSSISSWCGCCSH